MGVRRDEMQDVELVELRADGSDGSDGHTAWPDGSTSPGHRGSAAVRAAVGVGRWARHNWRAVLAAGVIVALGIGGVHVQRWRAERAYLESIEGRPGILAPLDASPHELWRTDSGLDMGAQWQAVGDALVGATQDADGTHLVALDVQTGAVLWDVRESDEPVEVSEFGYAPPDCVPVEASSVVLVCVTGSWWTSYEDGTYQRSATQRRATVVEVGTGEVVGRHDVGSEVALAQVGGGVVIAESQPDGHVRATLHDPVTWEERWAYDGAVPPEPAVEPSESDVQMADDPRIVAIDGRIAVSDRSGAVAVLSETGELVEEFAGIDGGSWVEAVGGYLLRYAFDESGDGGEVLDLTSGRSFPGSAWLGDTDGSLGTTVLTGDNEGLRLVDLDSGEQVSLDASDLEGLWEVDVVRGQILLGEGGTSPEPWARLAAYDGATGALRWTSELHSSKGNGYSNAPVYASRLTDGRHLFVIDTAEEGTGAAPEDWRLVAISTADGHRAWDIALPDGVSQLVEHGGRLYGFGDAGAVVALG